MKKYIIFDFDGTLLNSNSDCDHIIIEELQKISSLSEEEITYFISQSQGMGIREVCRKLLKIHDTEAEKYAKLIYQRINEETKANFFPGAVEIIAELSKKYTLFLSTGNSSPFAEKHLKKAGIFKCFKKILGSEYILKSPEHIEILQEFVDDEKFCENAVFVGDGARDREIAQKCNITFIHIDRHERNLAKDTYEISCVTEIENILKKL